MSPSLHDQLKYLDEIDLIDLLQIDSAMIVEAFAELIETNYDYLKEQLQTTKDYEEDE